MGFSCCHDSATQATDLVFQALGILLQADPGITEVHRLALPEGPIYEPTVDGSSTTWDG